MDNHTLPSTVNTALKMDVDAFAEYFKDLQNQV